VWADLISVFSYLNNFTLYEYTSGTGAAASMVPISLGDLLGALVIVGITFALARNLPGLLEVLVLSKLNLAQGSAYATTTLLSYIIVGVGFVSTLSTLGVSWDKLQWLVAALSVGLGFGMQEIFANFISGIMILFERPVRIGDTITIGNLSGTVSKIRIRATTITDFDRKDIIVPNKTFITGQLINWSLTDTITRVTLKLGIDYGSDLDLVKELLLKAARENPRVLKEPGADRVLPQLRRKHPRPRTAHARARPRRPQPDARRGQPLHQPRVQEAAHQHLVPPDGGVPEEPPRSGIQVGAGRRPKPKPSPAD
jgi:potassium efflux system protein